MQEELTKAGRWDLCKVFEDKLEEFVQGNSEGLSFSDMMKALESVKVRLIIEFLSYNLAEEVESTVEMKLEDLKKLSEN